MAGPLTKAGRYEIVAELGRGSMGVVYRGFDPVIGRTVAIKTMLIEGLPPSEFEEYKQRFQREAQSAGVLTHPNIVTVYDFGEDSGVLFLAMEFLEGKSLQQLVEQRNLMPIETLVPMYEQICSALDHAHQHRIVHRDVKPANIMILESGLVKVMDFGIAKVMSMGMTQAGQILGTPNYMSPEQVKGRAVDGRSDIFSLGVILYELVTGEKPFGGQNITTVIYKIINEDPIPPRQLDSSIHPGLSYVISKALAKNPAERYQTCRELAEDLRNYKNLGNMGAPSATLVVKVPPISAQPMEVPPPPVQPPPPRVPPAPVRVTPPPRPVARPVPSPMERPIQQVAPPRQVPVVPPVNPAPQEVRTVPPVTFAQPQKSSSSVAWVFLIVILLAGVGVGGFYYYNNIYLPQHKVAETIPPPTGTQPGTTAPTAGTQGGTTTPSGTSQATQPSSTTTPGTQPGATSNQPSTSTTQLPTTETTTTNSVKPPADTTTTSTATREGRVSLASSPRGASISVDNQDTQWVTPHVLQLAPGDHEISLALDGYKSEKFSVTVEGGKTTSKRVQLAEEAPPTPAEPTKPTADSGGQDSAGISIVTTPSGIDISIDGVPRGKSPVNISIAAGEHTLTYVCPGSQPENSSFKLNPGSIGTKRITCAR